MEGGRVWVAAVVTEVGIGVGVAGRSRRWALEWVGNRNGGSRA